MDQEDSHIEKQIPSLDSNLIFARWGCPKVKEAILTIEDNKPSVRCNCTIFFFI